MFCWYGMFFRLLLSLVELSCCFMMRYEPWRRMYRTSSLEYCFHIGYSYQLIDHLTLSIVQQL